jgi:iron complex transport system ATP-binding protein
MQEYSRRTLDTMSDGECQRVMVARALAQDTPVILLDEPTSFLDLPNRYELCVLLGKLAHELNKCVLYSRTGNSHAHVRQHCLGQQSALTHNAH